MSATENTLKQTLHTLYIDHHSWLYGWLRKRLGCAHNAADLAHDTFARIIASRDALSLNEPRAYLVTTAKRLIIDQTRRRQIEQAYLAHLALAAESNASHPSSEHILAAMEALDQIAAALDGLDERPRRAFLLHYLDGENHAAVAVRLGVSDRMVRKYLVQALVHCHRALET